MILQIFTKQLQEIGNIQWSIENNIVSINWMNVEEPFRSKGYSYLLLIAMLSLQRIRCGTIQLDDCSDRSLSKDNVYYKTGFRIPDDKSLEQMILHIASPNKKYTGYTYPGDLSPTPVESIHSMYDFLVGLKDRLPHNFMELNYFLDNKDITTGMLRRFKTLKYTQQHSFGKNIHEMLRYLKKYS